jgi:polyribonucleotide nucleotidyltransferase
MVVYILGKSKLWHLKEDVKTYAPKLLQKNSNSFIGALIGPGGKVIQELQKTTGTTIVINEDPITEEGVIEILGTDPAGIEAVWLKLNQYFQATNECSI